MEFTAPHFQAFICLVSNGNAVSILSMTLPSSLRASLVFGIQLEYECVFPFWPQNENMSIQKTKLVIGITIPIPSVF